MWCRIQRSTRSTNRRALVSVQVVLTLSALVGFAALAVDVSMMYEARSCLQRAADAAALAGASGLTTDAMMAVRAGDDEYDILVVISGRAAQYCASNNTLGAPTFADPGDIVTGWVNLTSPASSVATAGPASAFNAVRVTARREDDGTNGPVDFVFAPIFGKQHTDVLASSTAAFDDRLVGYRPPSGSGPLIPFTIDETVFVTEMATGGDGYGYDEDTGTVEVGGDGVREINLYPHVTAASGNFGLLNIGTPNHGTPALRDHIEDGVPAEDLEIETGASELTFYDEDGNPTTYYITGDPGLRATLESSVEERVGDVVGYLLHDSVVPDLHGSNATYHITEIRFARVMAVELHGGPSNRGIWLQPVSYAGSSVIVGPNAPSSGGVAGRIVLVR